jgi:hypothetical protein
MDWTIPIVIFGLRTIDPNGNRTKILEVVRNVFVMINKQARQPNRARTILLDDESINCICTQELLDYSHSNDIKDFGQRDPNRPPLLFYDWRGAEIEGRPDRSPAFVKTSEEICDWFINYLLDEDFSPAQKVALGILPTDNDLQSVFLADNKKVDSHAGQLIRQRIRKNVLPGLTYFLENFKPYNDYIKSLRMIEQENLKKGDLANYALNRLRFGSSSESAAEQQRVSLIYNLIVEELEGLKHQIPQVLADDIGMRGIMWAFGAFRRYYQDATGATIIDWLPYCKWFTEIMNKIYEEGWFEEGKKEHFYHVIYDHNEKKVNYRLDEQDDALGALVVILLAAYSSKKNGSQISDILADNIWGDYSSDLSDTIEKGYKKEVRTQLKQEGRIPEGSDEFKKAVEDAASRKAVNRIKKLKKFIDAIERF